MADKEKKKAVKIKYDSKDILVRYAEYDVDGNEITTTYAKKKYTQEPLLSGYNIKTVNGESILGSGDLHINADGSKEVERLREDLSEVALTGDYNDLKNVPDFSSSIPTKLSDLVNDIGYITRDEVSDEALATYTYTVVSNNELDELGIDPNLL